MAGLQAAMAVMAAMSSWNRASGTTRLSTSAYNPEYKGQRGQHGMGSNCTGKMGKDVFLKVPVGTVVYDFDTNELVH